ncbi:MAG: ATP-dependent Clp protease proteolytic subunit [Lachnospiraceae bacterium]|nr:ATP-dependent Clp protease proteolytic subunit [Lachnospiraceae bacterium]
MANVIIESVRGYDALPIEDVFLKDRKIFLVGQVNDASCNDLIKELLYMEAQDTTQPIVLFINSPGGDVGSGLAVYDTIRLLKSPVYAVVTGIAASMGSIILLACDKEHRLILPSSKVMIHDCSYAHHEVGGRKPHEIEEDLKQLQNINERLISIIAERTGKTVKQIAKVTKSDTYFTAQEAIDFGLISRIIDSEELSTLIQKGGE